MPDQDYDISPPILSTTASLVIAAGCVWLGVSRSLAAGNDEPFVATLASAVIASVLLVAGWIAFTVDRRGLARRLAASAVVPPIAAVAWTLTRSY